MLSTLRTTGLCSLIVLHGCAVLYRNLRVANNYLFIMKIYNLLFSSIQGDHDVYLFGQDHFIRKKPKEDTHMTNGRYYDFTDIMKWKHISYGKWKQVPEGPLPYSPKNIFHTPDLFKNFLTNNVKFGASFEVGCCYWQHFFLNGTHYKVMF